MGVLAVVAGIALAAEAAAGVVPIEIDITGLSLAYGDNQSTSSSGSLPKLLYDSHNRDGGTGKPDQATNVGSFAFYSNGVMVGKVDTNQGDFARADVWIPTPPLPFDGTTTTSNLPGRFVFDLLLVNAIPGWGLALTEDQWALRSDSTTIAGDASAVLCSTCQPNQAAIFGLVFDPTRPIHVSFTVTRADDSTDALGAPIYVGSAKITGMMATSSAIPEPASAVLAILGAAGLLGFAGVGRSLCLGASS
ncbi:hypothetical protein [Aquisphaera giovannonii]|uniref:hypothetical protein n=1 Tax=Aquisphaera giovannonii TaxID=406548 RepID=UPI001AEFC279|nr:hypothetical protein [Aquisphaera giovannonii]